MHSAWTRIGTPILLRVCNLHHPGGLLNRFPSPPSLRSAGSWCFRTLRERLPGPPYPTNHSTRCPYKDHPELSYRPPLAVPSQNSHHTQFERFWNILIGNIFWCSESGAFVQNLVMKNLLISLKIWWFLTKSQKSGDFAKIGVFYETPRIWWFFFTKSKESGDFVKNLGI